MLYVIQVQAGNEQGIANRCNQLLITDGEEAFVPQADRRQRIKGAFRDVRLVLFPGYVFFRTDDPVSLYKRLKTIPCMTKLLRMAEDFCPVYPQEEKMLLRLCGRNHVAEMSTGIIEGDRVKILSGPMSELEGKIRRIDRHKRLATVEIDMLGQTRNVLLGLEIIEKR